jgi:hypothetical protein
MTFRNRAAKAMNSMTIGEIRNAAGGRDPSDEKMEQIRDLLFGEFQRQSEGRINQLETRIRDLETNLQRKLDALQARFDALTGETQADRRSAFDELARGVQELGERIRQIPRD